MSKKTGNRNKISFGIMQRILAIAFVPLLFLAVIIAAFSARTIRTGMQDEAIKRLRDIAIGVEQVLLAADEGDFYSDGQNLYRGEYNISEDLSSYEAFSAASDIEITICWGDTRMMTTLKDEKTGESMVGTKVSETVVQNVLKDGAEHTDKDMFIDRKSVV